MIWIFSCLEFDFLFKSILALCVRLVETKINVKKKSKIFGLKVLNLILRHPNRLEYELT